LTLKLLGNVFDSLGRLSYGLTDPIVPIVAAAPIAAVIPVTPAR